MTGLMRAGVLLLLAACATPSGAADCELFPLALPTAAVEGIAPNTVLADVKMGAQPGNFGWLTWAGNPSDPTLVESLTPPGDSGTYQNPDDPSDRSVSVGDWVQGKPGVSNSRDVRAALDVLKGIDIVVPLWNDTRGQGNHADYRVDGFAKVRLLDYRLSGKPVLSFRFLELASCGDPGNEPPVAVPQSLSLLEGTFAAITLSGADPEGEALQFQISTAPLQGALSGTPPDVAYHPAPGFHGGDSFAFVVSDAAGAVSQPALVDITVVQLNRPPTVDAGPDLSPAALEPVGLQGSVADDGLPQGGEVQSLWRVVGGDAACVAFDDPGRPTATATFSAAGVYTLRLTATDGASAAQDDTTVAIRLPNQPPAVDAGPDFELVVGELRPLAGSVADDGLPEDGLLFAQWSVQEGHAAAVEIVDSSDPRTSVRFAEAGTYVLRLFASDGVLEDEGSVTVAVLAPQNQPPVVDAGPHQDLSLFASARLMGSAADDGLPEAGSWSQLWTQAEGPGIAELDDPSALRPAVQFPAPGLYRFRLEACDGELTSAAETTVAVALANQPPVADAGPDSEILQGSRALLQGRVTDDGLPAVAGAGGALSMEWTVVSGPGGAVFERPDSAVSPVEVSTPGEYVFRLRASDGECEAVDEVAVRFGPPVNQPPTVDAGPDREVDFNLVRTDNLINNPGAESRVADGVIPGWTQVAATWQTPTAASLGLTAAEGDCVFQPDPSTAAELQQDVDVSVFSDTIEEGRQLFEFSVAYRVAEQVRYDEPRVRIEYRSAEGALLAVSDIAPTPIASSWGLLADTRMAPPQTRSVRVRLFAENSGVNAANDVFFDAVTLRGVELAPVSILGSVTDDGLPEAGELSWSWHMVSGPVAAIFEDPSSLDGKVFFSAPGIYELALDASDGEASTEDRLTVSVVDNGGGQPLCVDAGTNQVVYLPLAVALPVGVVGGSSTHALTVSWTEVGGHSRVFIEHADTLNPLVRFYELGEYVLRLSVSDGTQVAYDEMRVEVACPEVLQPMDVALVIDQSASMTIPTREKLDSAHRAATLFAARLLSQDRAAVVPFKREAVVTQPLTFDYASVTSAIPVAPAACGNGTEIDKAISVAAGHLMAEGRPEAEWVILLLSDGKSDPADAIAAAQAAHASGIRIISVGLCNGTDEDLMSAVASSRGDYFFADAASDLEPLYASLSRSFCRFGVDGLTVHVGPTLRLPNVETPGVLAGRVAYAVSSPFYAVSSEWSVVSGPGAVLFDDASSPATTARFAEPGVYVLALTGSVAADGVDLGSRRRTLTVVVDQPSACLAPDGLAALWEGEGNVRDSVANFHGVEPAGLAYGTGAVHQACLFDGSFSRVRVPTLGQLDVGSAEEGFTVEFWARLDATDTTEQLFGWYDAAGNVQIGLSKAGSSNRYLRLQLRDAAGTLATINTPIGTYSIGQWHHFAIVYDRPQGLLSLFRDGAWLQGSSAVGTDGYPSDGDFYFGGNPDGTVRLRGGLDELGVYDRPLAASEVWAIADAGPGGKVVLGGNEAPFVDAGVDRAVAASGADLALSGYATDDGLPLGSVLRTRWRCISGPADVVFDEPAALATSVSFSTNGIYSLELAADDGVAEVRDTVRIVVGGPEGSMVPPPGLLAHWPAEGSGREVVSGFHAAPVGAVAYAPAVVGSGFQHGKRGSMLAPTEGGLDAGASPQGFTVEFWTRIDSHSPEQALAGWFDAGGAQFAVLKRATDNRRLAISCRPASGPVQTFETGTSFYTLGRWHHIAVTYAPETGRIAVYRDGLFRQAFSGPAGGVPTPGDFSIGGRPGSAVVLDGATDEVSVYGRRLGPDEIWAVCDALPFGKAVMDRNLVPSVEAGDDLVLSNTEDSAALTGTASDDGLPLGSALRTSWRMLSGPGAVAFGDASAPATTAAFSEPGIYTLELLADDGIASANDTLRVAVGWAEGALPPPPGLLAHWPAEGTGREVVSGFHAAPVGTVAYAPAVVGSGFQHGAQGSLIARTDGALNAGVSPDGFTVEFRVRISSYPTEQAVAGWFDADGAQFAVLKRSSSNRYLGIVCRPASGPAQTFQTDSGFFTVGQWHHIAVTYAPETGRIAVYRDGLFRQAFDGPAGGLPTPGDFCIGGRPDAAVMLSGATDEVCVHGRRLDAAEIWASAASAPQGIAVMGGNRAPVAAAGPDVVLGSVEQAATLNGFAADDGLPVGSTLRTRWRLLTGPGTVSFDDETAPRTTARFEAPGIYTLELSACDGLVVSRSTLRAEVAHGGAVPSPSGLLAHWPAEGTGREVVSGFHAAPVGAVAYAPAVVGSGFQHGAQGFLLVRAEGGLDAGASPDGFTVEFWSRITSSSTEQAVAGWFDADGAQFAVLKRSTSYRRLAIACRPASGPVQTFETENSFYTVGQWHHIAVTYEPGTGRIAIYRDGLFRQVFDGPAGGVPTPGDFCIGGRTDSSVMLSGATDEVCVYGRTLAPAELQGIHAAGAAGRIVIPSNQRPIAFAGFDRELSDTLAFSLAGFACDDGVPSGQPLQTVWTQLEGPSAAQISAPSALATPVEASALGRYVFRLAASDGELEATSVVAVELRSSTPPNQPPVVDAGEPLEITLPAVAVLSGSASDPDGGPLPLAVAWSRATGPGTVAFANPSSATTTAAFGAPGVYTLRLTAADGEATVHSYVAVVVHPHVANEAPVADAGDDFTVAQWAIIPLAGAASDDGLPAPLTVAWTCLSGPAPVVIASPGALDSLAQFTQLGQYVLQLRAFDGEKQSLDTVTVTVVDPSNEPPAVDAGGRLDAVLGVPVALRPVFGDDGLPNGTLTFGWRYEAGSGGCAWGRNADGSLSAAFSKVGDHALGLTVSDGEYSVTDTLVVTVTAPGRDGPAVALTAPLSGTVAPAGASLVLEAAASDPDGTVESVSFHADGVLLGSVAGPGPWRWTWQNIPEGSHVLHAEAVNEIAQKAVSAPVSVEVEPVAPGIRLAAPAEGSFHPVNQPVVLQAAISGGVAVGAVEFLVDGAVAATRAAPPYVATALSAVAGTVQLQARAALSDGGSLLSAPVAVTFVEPSVGPPVLELASPAHGSTVTAPVSVVGVVHGANLAAYNLELRHCPDDADDLESWRIIGTGTAPRGAPGAPASLGTLDPTLLRNGAYELRIVAADCFGAVHVLDGHSLVLAGNMKVGHFQLGFEDLNIPLAGIPVQILRSYDSRGGLGGDFGPGWDLGFRSVQVQTSAPVGGDWEDYVTHTAAGIPFYGIRPVRRHVVSVAVGDEIQQFEVYSPTEQGFFPLEAASVAFRPINGSTGSLTLRGEYLGNLFVTRQGDSATLLDIATFAALEPQDWVYTTVDGTRLDIRSVFGLRKLTDRNANSLTFTATGITHSSGESIAFTRDAEGRIAAISIPGGDSLRYGYDGHGYLSTFIDAAGAVTAFGYVPHPAAPGRRLLESITDPLGNRALAASYDGDGRLTGQRDALGNAVAFAHDIPNRRHTVTGRLGNATVHEYDLRGNIVRTVDPLGNETLRAYDALDNEVAVTDPLGNTTTSTYDAKRNKLTETDPLGNTTRTTYNESNQPLTLTDAKGNTTSFAYDANGNVTSMADALGGATSFGYDARGNLLSMRDATGNTATYAYDSRGRVISTVVTDATGGVCRATSSGYDNRGNQIAAIAVRTLYANDGAVIGTEAVTNRYEYDSENRVTRTIHPDGTTSETEYNPAGEELRTVDALGLATENKHDAKGNLIRTDHPDGTSTVWSYDAEDRQTSEIHYDADGHVFKASSTEYDALGRQVSIVQADSLDPEGRPVGPAAYTVYDPIGRTVISYDERGNATAYEYDPASGSIRNSARAIDALGNITSYEYDANGNKTAVIDAGGHVTEFTYDAQNRLVRVTHPDATTTETVYDPAGRRSAVIDELGRRTDYAYDSLGRLLEVVQPAPTSQQPRPATRYAYDEAGNRIAQTDALGRTTRYRYDCMGRRVARILPGGEIESNAYDAVGQLSARTDFNGYATTFAYDALGRLVEESADPAHPSLGLAHVAARNTHAFDASGRPVHSRVWNGEGGLLHEEALSYDLAGRLVQATTSYGSLAYAYDAAGNLTGVASGNADGVALAYAYDELNRLQFVVDHGAAGQPLEHHYTYTPVGSLASVAYANGVTHAYAYNGRNRLTGLHISDAHGSLLNAFDYQLNAAGHRTRIDEATGRTRLFQYDNLNRLASEQITGDPAGVNGTVSYAHDLVGNRIASASTLPGVASQSNSYSVNDRLDSDACDDNGNTVAAAGITTRDVYDAWNRLVRRVKPDGTVVDLGYDHAGNRVSKTVTTLVGATFTAYLVDANSLTGYAQVLEELRDDGAGALEVFRTYAAGNDLIGQRQLLSDGQGGEAWVTHYHLCDGQGSVWGLADESGALTDYYAYDAYGIHLYEAGAGTPNLLRYTGEQWDSDLGQYYLRARFYEPTRGRFWTMDSYEGSPADPISLHKYLYANANPVMYVDPSGMYGFSVGELSFVQALQSKMRVWFYTPMATQLPRVYMALARCVNAFNLQFTKTIELYNRSYYSSRLLIQEIIRSGTICRDPGGVVTAIRYVANGSLNGSPGFYELVIDLKTNTILHFLFKGL